MTTLTEEWNDRSSTTTVLTFTFLPVVTTVLPVSNPQTKGGRMHTSAHWDRGHAPSDPEVVDPHFAPGVHGPAADPLTRSFGSGGERPQWLLTKAAGPMALLVLEGCLRPSFSQCWTRLSTWMNEYEPTMAEKRGSYVTKRNEWS